MSFILDIGGLNKLYDNGVHAVKDVSFQVKPGEFVAIIGLSGSGKSTLLRCVNRLIEPSSGEVLFHSKTENQIVNITKLNPRALRHYRQKIAMIFQHFNLVKRKSVLTNVLSGGLGSASTVKGVFELFSPEERARAHKHLETVGLADKWKNRADELSGGQQQRVAIARALMQDPEILLADEPVASLDPATSHSVMNYLEYANRELGKTIICNLHFLSLVRQYATRVIALKKGEMVFDGSAHDIDEAWFREIYGEEAREVEIR
jgi:phosphonate transport system ATP-binding protein